ncbi:PmeII family type II restriction endonuclease [Nostoc sp.]|uniref:PmeII family type II restriction endonuclease n=1 Tax=Nostoc sp. TaxID=1180 RepID=UPI003FA5545B
MLAYALKNEVDFTPKKARSLASYFADIKDFLEAKEENIKNLKSISGKNVLKFTDEEIKKLSIYKTSGYLSAELTVAENYLAVISRVFTQKQLDMVRSLSLKHLNPNPFLIRALNLDTPDEVVRLNVYMAATRSIVTCMGFFIEDLLLTSSDTIEKVKKSGWDLVKTTSDGEKCWLQIKSGPNNMDKDQVVYWAEKIQDKVKEGDKAYIGFTYGKRTSRTVTIGLLKQILPDWQMQTLIGKELWDFLSEDPDYSSKLFEVLRKSAHQILHQNSLSEEIDSCATKVTDEFIQEFGDGAQGVSNYINSIY